MSARARSLRRWLPLVALVTTIVVWEAVIRTSDIPSYLFPAPSAIVQSFLDDPGLVWQNTLTTGSEAVLGFLLGVVIGVVVAVAIAYSQTVERIIYPYLVLTQVTPIVAIAPLLVIWFGIGLAPKVVVAFLVAFFPIAVNFAIGLKSPDRDMILLMRSLAASEPTVFRKIRVPFAMPYLFSAFRIAAPATVIGAIVGEFVTSNKGLGFMIVRAKATLDTATLFLAMIASALLGLFMFAIFGLLERRLLRWHESQSRTVGQG